MDVIKSKKIFRIFSCLIILAGIIMFFVRGFNLGIDFVGGTIIEINTGQYIEEENVRKILDNYDKKVTILYSGKAKDHIIIKSANDISNADVTEIVDEMKANYPSDKFDYQSEKFEPLMGKEIKRKAIVSTTIAVIAMLIYITVRFKFSFGLSAIVALIHDILIMLSFYLILNIPVDGSFIAAILTILGYSINDTIVIFDRIRENQSLYPKWNKTELVNNSIKQSFRRTVYTSLTTFISVGVVYAIGVEDMKILALPLMIGIIAGTYSSLFIASPLWLELSDIEELRASRA